jgi:hypothetical protein
MATRFAVLALPALLALGESPVAGTVPAVEAVGSITFRDARARAKFDDYVAFLTADREKFSTELETLRHLSQSDVEYHVSVSGTRVGGVEGRLTTDGSRILVTVFGAGGPSAGMVSLNSRFAHELEHARQFDDGELAFAHDPESGRWHPLRSTYDIGDEVKAWEAQLKASVAPDFWDKRAQMRERSLLGDFALARTFEDRVRMLIARAYPTIWPVCDCDVVVTTAAGYVAGQLVRPDQGGRFFGRVRRVRADP